MSDYPQRLSSTLAPGGYPLIADPIDGTLYPYVMSRQPRSRVSDLRRKRTDELRRFANTPPAHAAITQITNGILNMDWQILPPIEEIENEVSLKLAEWIEKALREPNREITLNSYGLLISAIVDDMLVLNRAFIERQPGDENQVFWWWVAGNPIQINKEWSPHVEGVVAKFYDRDRRGNRVPILAANMFMIINNVNAHELIPPGPLEVAFNMIEAWLGVNDYQQRMTSNSTAQWILDLGDVSKEDVIAFRTYWKEEVKDEGQMPIGAGKGAMRAIKIGANDDNALYHKYCEYVLRIIALVFQLSPRDSNIQEQDNRATAGVAADQTFANAVRPLAARIFEAIGKELVSYFFPGYRLKVDYSEPRSRSQREAQIIQKFTEGIAKRNETRIALGDDPLPDEDDGFNTQLSNQISNQNQPEKDPNIDEEIEGDQK